MRKLLVFTSLCFAFSACQQTASETKPTNVNKAQNIAPSVSPTAAPTATPDKSKIKTFKGKGVVTKINLELVSVELDHEKIEDFMAAMKMEFYVKEKSELETLKVGDKVDFVLEDNAGAEVIINIKKAS